MSGLTTTGATVLTGLDSMSKGILLWRSMLQWIGGAGIVILAIMVLPTLHIGGMQFFTMESSAHSDRDLPTVVQNMRVLLIYLIGLTITCAFALKTAGMNWFDAVNHAFSIAATGGFSTRNLSVGYYQSDLINLVVIFYMAVCALHFGLIYAVFVTRSLKPMKNSVIAYFFGSILVASLVVGLVLKTQGGYEQWGRAFMDSTFTVVSYMSTTGFAICDNSTWPWVAGVVLLFVSFQCGCSGSTTGCLKGDRVLIAFKSIGNEIRRRSHPNAVAQIRLDGHYLPESTVSSVMMYIVTYFIMVFISIIIVMLCGSGATEAVSGVIASLGSVGPGLGELGAMDNFSAEPAMSKFVYAFDMFLGRVEIYPVLVVLSMIFNRGK